MTHGWLEWATAIGTIAAAAVPAILWFFERRDRKDAQSELRAREAAEHERSSERQAREVFVWKIWGDYEDERDGVTSLNTSQLPIFDVCLYAYNARTNRYAMDQDGYVYAVMPGERFGAAASGSIADEVWITFRDASGREWARNHVGLLVENPDREGMIVRQPSH